jgi:hypothetical protein
LIYRKGRSYPAGNDREGTMFFKFRSNKKSSPEEASLFRANHGLEIDPEMNYCPDCGDEYRADILRCGICDRELVGGKEKIAQVRERYEQVAGRTMDILPSDELVTIQKGLLKDVKVLRNLLEKQRIPALIAGDEATCRKSCCGPEMFLQIRKQDIAEAREILARDFVRSTALETHEISGASALFNPLAEETVCPACGCSFSPADGACPDCGLSFE